MTERGTIARHAGTVLAGQLATMAFGVTDTIVAGRYAEGALAALSVGSAIFISVFVSLMGVVQALLPVWAELHGARRAIEVIGVIPVEVIPFDRRRRDAGGRRRGRGRDRAAGRPDRGGQRALRLLRAAWVRECSFGS